MWDRRLLFSDRRLKEEFLDRFQDLADAFTGRGGGFETAGPTRADAERAIERMQEGVWGSDGSDERGVEAIIERFTRPVALVQDNTFGPPADGFPNSQEVADRLTRSRGALEAVIPSSGRIELKHHRLSWVGTGWMVKSNVVVTNRHVAEAFARSDAEFAFRRNSLGQTVRASLDWRREHQRPDESVFRVRRVIWIEPDGSLDVALLEIEPTGADGQAQPALIDLATSAELEAAGAGAWIAVIGYPAQDSRNDEVDQQRIFDGIFNVKRLAPGQIRAIRPDGLVTHDATTLGGNSGSAVISLDSGKAFALHFGGEEGEQNFAVRADDLKAIIDNRS